MRYHEMPAIGKPISIIAQGSVFFRDDNYDIAAPIYDALYAGGVTVFDTAHDYGDGASERILGRWIDERGLREQVVILDKGAHPHDGVDRVTPDAISASRSSGLSASFSGMTWMVRVAISSLERLPNRTLRGGLWGFSGLAAVLS